MFIFKDLVLTVQNGYSLLYVVVYRYKQYMLATNKLNPALFQDSHVKELEQGNYGKKLLNGPSLLWLLRM